MTKAIAVVLVVLGMVGLIWGGVSYTTHKKIVDLGSIQATHEERHSVPVPPVAGGIALLGGIVLLVSGRK